MDTWDVLVFGDTELGVQREQADDPLPGVYVPRSLRIAYRRVTTLDPCVSAIVGSY